jgi:ankyrin repeat protein
MYYQVKVLFYICLLSSLSFQGCTLTPQIRYTIPEKPALSQDQEFMPEASKLAIKRSTAHVSEALLEPVQSKIELALHAFTASSGETITFLQDAQGRWKAKVQDCWPGGNLTMATLSATSMLSIIWENSVSSPVTMLPILAKQPANVHKHRIHVVQDQYSRRRVFLGALGLLGGMLEEKESKQVFTSSLSLYEAAGQGNLEAVKQLLKNGDNPNMGYFGVTPLYIAAKRGYLEIVEALLAKKANVHMADRDGYTPLHMAAMHGHLEVVNLLLAREANVHSVNQYGDTALHGAAENGYPAVIQFLLNRNADPNSTNQNEDTPLHWAARNGHLEVVQWLLQKNADPNKVSLDGTTPLHEAARKGHIKVVELFLQCGIEPNIYNQDGETPLYWAAENGHLEVVQYLLQKDADPNKENIHGYTPLYRAVENGHLKVVQLLLDKKADPNKADNFACSPLHCAAEKGAIEVVKLLLEQGADLNNTDINGNAPLHCAADSGSLAVISILLKAGADTNAQNKHGDSFMHRLVANNLNLCLQGIKIIESDNALLLEILKSCINTQGSSLINIRDNLPIIVDYVKGLDCSLKNKQGQTIEQLLMREREKIANQDLTEICKNLEKHKQPGGWSNKLAHTTTE